MADDVVDRLKKETVVLTPAQKTELAKELVRSLDRDTKERFAWQELQDSPETMEHKRGLWILLAASVIIIAALVVLYLTASYAPDHLDRVQGFLTS